VTGEYAGIDDVGTGSCTSAVIIFIGGAAPGPVGDAAEAPWSASLRDISLDGDDSILFNEIDLPKWLALRLVGPVIDFSGFQRTSG
jgi:hypothetical protein